MIFSINNIKDSFLEKIYTKSIEELNHFFELNWTKNAPNIVVLPNRDVIDNFLCQKTENWLVAWAGWNEIFILDRNNYEKESNHKYSNQEYSSLIKHELSHLYIRKLKEKGFIPKWLEEGICIYVSGQIKLKKSPDNFNKFLNYYEGSGKDVYDESGFVIELLIKKFGKEKLLKLLTEIKNVKDKSEFEEKFKEIYNFDLDYDAINNLLGSIK